jgi:putative oxidoreductase
MDRLFTTDTRNTSLLVQRLVLALVFFPHGAQKALGLFGGYGWTGTMGFFTETVGLPAPLAALVILLEFLGPLALLLGLLARPVALGLSAVMVGAVLTGHLEHGFFMNWFGNQKGEGFEFHLLALALTVPLAIWGAGRASVDALIAEKLGQPAPRRVPAHA